MANKRIHLESLARLRPVQHLLSDASVRLAARAIDARWSYEAVTPHPVVGFNPLKTTVYYPAVSKFAKWLGDPHGSSRRFNQGDRLVREVMSAIHDYLHCWCNHALTEVVPEIGYGTKPIDRRNFEDFVFCHAVTEVAASVGTDYWFACTLELNEECDIGSGFTQGYQTPYHERDLAEFQRFNPDLEVQSKDFFAKFAEVYLQGWFEGFDLKAMRRSAKVFQWMNHEIGYGEAVRHHTRVWLSHLADTEIRYPTDKLASPIPVDKPWKRRLMAGMRDLLWEKVKEGKLHRFRHLMDRESTWSSERKAPDFRFVNANRARVGDLSRESFRGQDPQSFQLFFWQYVSAFDYSKIDPEVRSLFDALLAKEDPGLVVWTFRDQTRIPAARGEPYDLFVLP